MHVPTGLLKASNALTIQEKKMKQDDLSMIHLLFNLRNKITDEFFVSIT